MDEAELSEFFHDIPPVFRFDKYGEIGFRDLYPGKISMKAYAYLNTAETMEEFLRFFHTGQEFTTECRPIGDPGGQA